MAQRKWSFVRSSRPAVWHWFEALGVVVVSHALLFLLIGVKKEEPRSVSNVSSKATLLSGQALSPAEAKRMCRWMVLHDPASFADPGHAAGISGILPDVLHHEITAENPADAVNCQRPAGNSPVLLPTEALGSAVTMPLGKVEAPAPYRAQVLDSSGKKVSIPMAVDHETAEVAGPTVVRIIRQQEMALAIAERSCGVPALDALAGSTILRFLPEVPDGERFTVNWPMDNGGAK